MIFNILQALEKKYENIFKLSSSLCYQHLSHQNRIKILRAIHHLTLKKTIMEQFHENSWNKFIKILLTDYISLSENIAMYNII